MNKLDGKETATCRAGEKKIPAEAVENEARMLCEWVMGNMKPHVEKLLSALQFLEYLLNSLMKERVKEWDKVDEATASNLLFSSGIWESGERRGEDWS